MEEEAMGVSQASDSGGPAGSAVYRTSPERTAKMMAIMLGICVAGGGIFFGMWDYWISQTPPVVEVMAGDAGPAPVEVELTGVEVPVALSFVESADFRVLSFNAQPGEPGHNPTIEVDAGDRILFDVVNDGISFHSFGVTADEEGTGGIYPGSEVASANNPLTGGQSGTSEFVAPEDGIYYYICTVPGHRVQGMEGMIIVGDVDASEVEAAAAADAEAAPAEPAAPAVERVVVEGHEGAISVPEGSSIVGCEATDECYIPAGVSVEPGTTVTWSNDDTAAHTVTSSPDSPMSFDSGLFLAGATFDVTFDEPGEYPYLCIVHPWMTGVVVVGDGGGTADGAATADDDMDMAGDDAADDMDMAGDDAADDMDMAGDAAMGGGMADDMTVRDSVTAVKSAATPVSEDDADADAAVAAAAAGPVALDGPISIPEGTSIVGCEATDECYIPSSAVVPAGTTVTWSNDDTAAHTVTSTDDSPMSFDSSLFLAGTTFEVTFDEPGEYPYWCVVHPWMAGTIIVE